jgi:hypothetical protein
MASQCTQPIMASQCAQPIMATQCAQPIMAGHPLNEAIHQSNSESTVTNIQ